MARRGFTLLETVVVIGIIGLLTTLLISAVQATRTSASATECRNNLRQLALAVANYESQYGMYPNGMTAKCALLPFLDQQPLTRLNLFALTADDPAWAAVSKTNLPIYHCPSDPAPDILGDEATSNYVTCAGSGMLVGGVDGAFGSSDAFRSDPYPYRAVRSSDLIDGTSTTAGISEWLHSDGTMSRLRVRWQTPIAYSTTQVAAFQSLCESLPVEPVAFGWLGNPYDRGVPWFSSGIGIGQYNHMLPPNRPNCNNKENLASGIHTAASMHNGGAHVSFMDGHVTFVNENIDRRAWQRLGSRNDKAAGL